jgi:small subunit ribosomal protein S16
MLILRLKRTGRENAPSYRLVVAEKARPVKGGVLEDLGHYLPAHDPVIFAFRKERVDHWLSKGAAASNTVARLLQKQGVHGVEKYILRYTKRKPRGEAPPQPEVPTPAAAAPAEATARPDDTQKPQDDTAASAA